MNLVCFGSSITQAAGFPEGERWPTIVQYKLQEWQPGAWRVFNRGIGGHTTTNLLDRFETDVAPLLPGIVLLQVGGNDSAIRSLSGVSRVGVEEFARNLRAIHRSVTSLGGHLIFSTYHKFRMASHLDYKPYAAATRAAAEELGSPLIDLYGMMVERNVNVDSFVVEDGLHLSSLGNALYADMVCERLREILPAFC